MGSGTRADWTLRVCRFPKRGANMRILALDLATRFGWSCGSLEPNPIAHGVIALPKTGEDIGRFLAAFRDWLGHAIEELGPTEIVFESPILPAATSLAATRKLYSLAGVTEMVALDYGIPIREANLTDIRKHFIGTARAPKTITTPELRRRWLKDQTVEQCRRRGFRVADDNDADSLALLAYALHLKQPGYRLEHHDLRRAA